MPRRLHIISSADPAHGGPIEGIRQLAAATSPSGWDVEIASIDAPGAAFLQQFPLTVHPLGPGRTGYQYSPLLAPWLRANAHRFDAIVINGIWQHPSFVAHQVLTSLKIPYIVFTHGMLDPYFKSFRLKHIKKCLYWSWGQYPVLRDAAAVCFTCEEEKLLARQSFRPYQCNEVVISYGTAGPTNDEETHKVQVHAFLQRFPHLAGRKFLLFLSRLHPKKGCDLLIAAFAEIRKHNPDLHLVMAGPDQTGWQQDLQAQATQLQVSDGITWAGMLQGAEKWGAFRAADAFVLPSHQENFGIVVAEALSCGTPVLISDKVNIWREVQQDGAGLVARDTKEATEQLLNQWISLSSTERSAMQERAYTCFLSRFEISKAGSDLIQVLNTHARSR